VPLAASIPAASIPEEESLCPAEAERLPIHNAESNPKSIHRQWVAKLHQAGDWFPEAARSDSPDDVREDLEESDLHRLSEAAHRPEAAEAIRPEEIPAHHQLREEVHHREAAGAMCPEAESVHHRFPEVHRHQEVAEATHQAEIWDRRRHREVAPEIRDTRREVD
jgi:hypothetical protein